MPICAPNPFGCCGGSRLLKGGYSYWPLWWYGQRDELPDMSGHGVTLYPSDAYFDGQERWNSYAVSDDGASTLQPDKIIVPGTLLKIKKSEAGTETVNLVLYKLGI